MTPADPAKVLAKAAGKLCVPVGSVDHGGLIELPAGASPRDVFRVPVPPTLPSDDERRLMRVAYAICDADGRGKCDCHTDGVFTGGCCNDIRAMARAAIAAYEP